jgi:hypothetical protein
VIIWRTLNYQFVVRNGGDDPVIIRKTLTTNL